MADSSQDAQTQDAQTKFSHQQQADRLQLVPNLTPELRYQIYENLIDHHSRGDWKQQPYRQLKHPHLGIVDTNDILRDIWNAGPSIQYWHYLLKPAFECRGQWYRCHISAYYDRVVRDMKLRTHPDTLEDFKKYYWNTRVVDLKECSLHPKNLPDCPKHGYKVLKSNPHWHPYINHLSLDFSSTLNHLIKLYPPAKRIPWKWNDGYNQLRSEQPNSTIPDTYFTNLCNHIAANLSNLKTFYLWLDLTPMDIETIFSTPSNQAHPLVSLIRKISINKDGKFIVKLRVSPETECMMSAVEYERHKLLNPESGDYVMDWEGVDGPVRYGQMCRGYEKKFEALMRPESLGPAEGDENLGELERNFETLKISEELRVLKDHYKRHEFDYAG